MIRLRGHAPLREGGSMDFYNKTDYNSLEIQIGGSPGHPLYRQAPVFDVIDPASHTPKY